jgi:hypothetical protein
LAGDRGCKRQVRNGTVKTGIRFLGEQDEKTGRPNSRLIKMAMKVRESDDV